VTEEENGSDVGGIGGPLGADRLADTLRAVVPSDLFSYYAPAVPHQVALKSTQFTAQRARNLAFDHENDFASRVDERRVDADHEVSPSGIVHRLLFDLILVDTTNCHVFVDVGTRAGRQGNGWPPNQVRRRFSPHRVTRRGYCVDGPLESNSRGRRLHSRMHLHAVRPRPITSP
jgi:hypothetical protein